MAAKTTAANQDTIRLLKPHTHAGRDYPAGAALNIADIKMDRESAAWLVAIQTAAWVASAGATPAPIVISAGDEHA